MIEADPAQAAVVARLDELARALRRWRRRRNGLAALLSRAEPAPKGLYIFGSVGRGKTMLMDLFFETTTYRYKRRAHFHEFMAEVHDRIAEARKSASGRSHSPGRGCHRRQDSRCCASMKCTSPTLPTR